MSKTGACELEGLQTLIKADSHLCRILTPRRARGAVNVLEGPGPSAGSLRKVMLEPNPEELVGVAQCGEGRGIQTKEEIV